MVAQLLSTIENSRAHTLAVANALPADRYKFRPTDPVFSFAELHTHIGYGILWWEKNYISRIKFDWAPDANYSDKNDIIRYLEKSFDTLKESVSKAKPDDGLVQGVYSTLDHVTHHRGQATVYLRLNGITPPEYIF